MPTLSIIIPCYNESSTISEIINEINEVELLDSVKKRLFL